MSRPIDQDWLRKCGEAARAELLRGPDPAFAARGAKESRVTNSHLNRVEIGRYNEQGAALEQNNSQLTDFGDPAITFETTDPLGLHWRALRECIAVRDRLIWQQNDRLDYLRACAEETARERMIANETPIERLAREVAELRAENQARKDEIEAQRSESQRGRQYVPPPRAVPLMSNLGMPMANGLNPECAIAPTSHTAGAVSQRGAGAGAGRADNLPAMTHVHLERHGHGDTPEQFQRAIEAGGARR